MGWGSPVRFIRLVLDPEVVAQASDQAFALPLSAFELDTKSAHDNAFVSGLAREALEEVRQGGEASRLFIDAAANALAVHVLRRYSRNPPLLRSQVGGLAPRCLRRVYERWKNQSALDHHFAQAYTRELFEVFKTVLAKPVEEGFIFVRQIPVSHEL